MTRLLRSAIIAVPEQPAVRPASRRDLAMRRVIVSLLMVIALVGCVPIAYALTAGLIGWSTVADGGATSGTVQVTACPSPVQPCRGTFGYADPGGAVGAQPSDVSYSVPIANDLRRHRTGTVVAASLDPGHHRAYLSGNAPLLLMLVSITAIAYVVTCTVLVGRQLATGQSVAYAGPIAAAIVTFTLAAGLLTPFGDHGRQAAPPNAPAPAQPGG
jgi:hypothetical protein